MDDRVRNPQGVVTHTVQIDPVLLKIKSQRGRDDEHPIPDSRTHSLMQLMQRFLSEARAGMFLMIENQYAGAFEETIKLNASDLVPLIAALEELQGKETPCVPREFFESREV